MSQINNLIRKLVSLGSYISDDIEIRQTEDGGNGIFTKSNIAKDTNVISIPLSSCITVDRIISDQSLKKIFEENPGLLSYSDEILAIGIMYGKLSQECDWRDHVMLMPQSIDTTIYWDDESVEELRPSPIYHLTKMMNNQIKNDFQNIHYPLSQNYLELNSVDFELYKWALSMVYSRSIEVTKGIDTHVRCIVPILDMANHDPSYADSPFDAFHFNEKEDRIELKTARDLKQSEECYAVYDLYPNAKLLYNYGFCLLNNPHKAIDLWTKPVPANQNYEFKQKILYDHEMTRNQSYDFKGTLRPNYISPALLATIRVIQADEKELESIENAFHGKMISPRNELATYTSLRSLIISRMTADRAESDRKSLGDLLLSKSHDQQRKLNYLILRVGERDFLQEMLTYVDSLKNALIQQGESYMPPDSEL